MDKSKSGGQQTSHYFHANRTQPFLITFFQAVLAFRKILKVMRLRISKRQVTSMRRRSTVITAVKLSKNSMGLAMHGKSVITLPIEDNQAVKKPSGSTAAVNHAKGKFHDLKLSNVVTVAVSRNHRIEEVNTQVSKVLDNFYTRIRLQARAIPLADRLDAALIQNRHLTRAKTTQNDSSFLRFNKRVNITNKDVTLGRKSTMSAMAVAAINSHDGRVQYGNNNYLGSFADAIIVSDTPASGGATSTSMYPTLENELAAVAAEKLDRQLQTAPDDNPTIGEYLNSTPIYYGATIAIQARHGGYLSYAANEIKVSAHKVLTHTRFIVKKSDDLTDVGVVKYGDALWLQTAGSSVLGAQYGSLVDKKRMIQPALVSCRRASMFKAQQYGRWIILNRDNPVGNLGKVVGHFDRVILEQEWCYLSSSSPYSASMYRIAENSDDAIAKKLDLFHPPEESVWRMILVALPSDEGDNERQRQLLLQQAKDQIDSSEQHRLAKSQVLLSSLASKLPDNLKDDHFMTTHMKHKHGISSETDYMLKLYREMEARDFTPSVGGVSFLSAIYGRDSPIVALKEHEFSYKQNGSNNLQQSRQSSRSPPRPSTAGSTTPSYLRSTQLAQQQQQSRTHLEVLQDQYWDLAQKLLVDSRAWEQLPRIMAEFSEYDRRRKEQAARVIQAWIRSALDSKFNFIRKFRRIDRSSRSKLEQKLMMRRKLLLEHGGNESPTKHQQHNNPFGSMFLTGGHGSVSPSKRRQTRNNAAQGGNTLQQSLNHNVLWQVIQRFRALGKRRRASMEAGTFDPNAEDEEAETAAEHAANELTDDHHQHKHEHKQYEHEHSGHKHEHGDPHENNAQEQKQKQREAHRPHLRRRLPQAHHINHLIYADEYDDHNPQAPEGSNNITISDLPKFSTTLPKMKRPISGNLAMLHSNSTTNMAATAGPLGRTTHNLLYNSGSFSINPQDAAAAAAVTAAMHRPTTAPSRVQYLDKDLAAYKLGRSEDRPHGLPADVFDELHGATNLKTGLKFLRAMSNTAAGAGSAPISSFNGTNNKEDAGFISGFKELRVTRRSSNSKARSRPSSGNYNQSSNRQSQSTSLLQTVNSVEKKQRPQSSSAAMINNRNSSR